MSIPFETVEVGVEKSKDGGVEVTYRMSEHTFDHAIVKTANGRGLSLEETIGEALRLELLFGETFFDKDKSLIYYDHTTGEMLELTSV